MYDYGEACPISKATSVLCERWTIQIIREMFLGSSRFSEFQKYLPKISPSLLNSRLKDLVKNGIAIRKRVPEKRGYEYHLTPAGKSLKPVLTEMGTWGITWIFDSMTDQQMDVATLLRDIAVLVDVDQLPDCDTVFQFTFTDLKHEPRRFVTIKDGVREVCDENPGYEVDVYFRSTLRTMSAIWWGETSITAARDSGKLQVTGPTAYTKNLARWFPVSSFAGCNPRRSMANEQQAER